VVADALQSISRDGYVTETGYDAVTRWATAIGYITKPIDIEDIYDGSFLENAWKALEE
jgi:hypothetical protein